MAGRGRPGAANAPSSGITTVGPSLRLQRKLGAGDGSVAAGPDAAIIFRRQVSSASTRGEEGKVTQI